MTTDLSAKQIDITGIVQGVGFRPYLFQLAQQYRLRGRVVNTVSGVRLTIEGRCDDLEQFRRALSRDQPPLARIDELVVADIAVVGFADFQIGPSGVQGRRAALIAPDVAVCADCLRELFDPADRRFGYPFINCTNCGPRYTIIDAVPYDRPNTTMREFTMCAACRSEYDDPQNRRFHAQPNACPQCGPQVILCDHHGVRLPADDPIESAAGLIREGRIVALKGLGGFHLAVDALQDEAVNRLRRRKGREEKPLAVMAPDIKAITGFCHVEDAGAGLLNCMQCPIVVLPKRFPERLAFSVAPRNHYYGVMLPYTPLHHLLLAKGFTALVMTSGNHSDDPIAIDDQDAFKCLGPIADFFLIHNRRINQRSDDSIVRIAGNGPRLLRRSRGYVPVPIDLRREMPAVLACGAELKNTICLTRGRQAFMSQHIGDLQHTAAVDFFEETICHLERVLDIKPEAVACDQHPDYFSSQWASRPHGAALIHVQHHHAHMAAAMAEHHLEGPVIGLALDGTGLGDDGTIWGGEVLLADEVGYRRAGHLETVPMPGGSAAIRSPWRMALAYLQHVYGSMFLDFDLPFVSQLDETEKKTVLQMAVKGLNAPRTSSLGRLFDGVAAMIGLRRTVTYEGQAALELEMIADGCCQPPYPFQWSAGPVRELALKPIISAVVDDIRQSIPAYVISRRFHQTVIDMYAGLCCETARQTGLRRVVLGGGCFQNTLLLEGLSAALTSGGLDVHVPSQVPANDGGLALGQALVAGAHFKGMKTRI